MQFAGYFVNLRIYVRDNLPLNNQNWMLNNELLQKLNQQNIMRGKSKILNN